MPAVLVVGVAEKAAGDRVRIAMDFGNEPLLIAGYTIVDFDVTVTAPLTVASVQVDYPFQISGLFEAGTAGTTYDVVFWIQLDDPDATELERTMTLNVL